MDFNTVALLCMGGMIFLLLLGVPIAWSLGTVSVVVGFLAFGDSALDKIGWTPFSTLYKMSWTPLPIFTFLACLISQTAMGEDVFAAARRWCGRLPGGLAVSTIFGEAVLASALGASTPTILAMGKIAAPEFERHHYNKGYAIAATVAAGTLGPLIPPSSVMIIYAVMCNAPLGKLLIAGIMPGILLAVMLAATAVGLAWIKPSLGPPGERSSWKDRLLSLRHVWPFVVIMLSIIGSIYAGIATATEAGGVGCLVLLLVSVAFYRLRWKGLLAAIKETTLLSGMVLILIVGSTYFSYIVSSSNLTEIMAGWVTGGHVPRIGMVLIVMVILLILGCFLDGITIILLTVPIFVPLLTSVGYDIVWLGVLYCVNIEIALFTPPMGLNLYVAKSAFGVEIGELLIGLIPFLIISIVFLFILVFVPDISLWLPNLMK